MSEISLVNRFGNLELQMIGGNTKPYELKATSSGLIGLKTHTYKHIHTHTRTYIYLKI